MNIIEYSIRLGKALNKAELGKEIKNIYVSLRDEHNKHGEKVVSHYQIYNQCVEHECSRNHFYGWSITYEKMKQYVKNDLDNGDKLILDTAKYVLENDEFKKMSDISEKMGKIAVKLSDAIICSKYDDDDVKDLLKKCMENACKLRVPLIAEVAEATDWYDCK